MCKQLQHSVAENRNGGIRVIVFGFRKIHFVQCLYVFPLPWKPKSKTTGSRRWEIWRRDWRQGDMPTRDSDTSETGRRWPPLDLVLHVKDKVNKPFPSDSRAAENSRRSVSPAPASPTLTYDQLSHGRELKQRECGRPPPAHSLIQPRAKTGSGSMRQAFDSACIYCWTRFP